MKLMKKLLTVAVITGVVMSLSTQVNAQNKKNKDMEGAKKELKAFPEAKEGMVRHVIFLESKSDESAYKVEIIPGKVMSVDCNHHTLMGELEEKDLQGWGYTYFDFTSDGSAASTRMMCPDQKKTNKFITGQTMIVRYNSKLPIVVYAPKGFEVKYKIWTAGKELTSSQQ